MKTRESLKHSYNEAANDYADSFFDELQKKQFDLDLLKQFSNLVTAGHKVCDLGCGPGHITQQIKKLGLDPIGIDLSENMISVAKERCPDIEFKVGDMLDLHLSNESVSGITAFYSIIHFPLPLLNKVFQEMYRVLIPNGVVLFSCHFGNGELEVDNWFDKGLKYHCHLYEPETLRDVLEKTGFSDISIQVRKPYEFEHETDRIFAFAQKKG